MPKELRPMTEVLSWLLENHPQLHEGCELDRSWIWLDFDLRGDTNKAARESIKAYGFRFCKNGHTLPNGKIAHWAHSCEHPISFHRKKKVAAGKSPSETATDDELAVLLA